MPASPRLPSSSRAAAAILLLTTSTSPNIHISSIGASTALPHEMDYVEHRMAHEAAKQAASSSGLVTPLNLILASALAYAIYGALFGRPAGETAVARPPPPVVFTTYTPHTLRPFDGRDGRAVYLAVRGRVFDVSRGRNFYGPGGPYANFAGRDASRGLACGSFDDDMLTKDLDAPLDGLDGLGQDELEALRGWEERFLEKYDVIGKLVSVGDYDEAARRAKNASS
ncbi:hypothetical protein CDD83_8483 [Cordyceps sp. RAO-2017]|nr:hypothetical protein CDD83_8483 [Cordyceps sp. RAO-2017]